MPSSPAASPRTTGPRPGGFRAIWWLLPSGALAILLPLWVLAGITTFDSGSTAGRLERVWGKHGLRDGSFHKPRAMATGPDGNLYIVDKTGRIQVFDRQGGYLRGWRTPASANGKPSGLSFDREGNLLVADTHYFRVLRYRPDGQLLDDRTLGGTFGTQPGQFGLVTDAVEDSTGCLYVAEYGEYDRIQKFAPDGTFLFQWGGRGSEAAQFSRPQNLAIDEQDRIWVADACNHRIQVFDARSPAVKLVAIWGHQGSEPGELRYPYDLVLSHEGSTPTVYVCEFGNHRVQKFTRDGQFLGSWGTRGRAPGELFNPWAIALDARGRLHVLDTYNHRVQRIRF